MAMVFCRGCGKEIHDSASSCPQCGAVQTVESTPNSQKSKWMAITSLVLGIMAALAIIGILDQGMADAEEILGIVMFAVLSIIFASISLSQKRWGKGLSIAGIVLSGISLLIVIGA